MIETLTNNQIFKYSNYILIINMLDRTRLLPVLKIKVTFRPSSSVNPNQTLNLTTPKMLQFPHT